MGISRELPGSPAFTVGDWEVHPSLDELRRDGRVVKLEPRTMRLLVCLAEQPGAVVSPDVLLDRVWPGVVVSQSSVYQAVASLRRELGDTGPEPRYVATVPRKGYRLVAPVRWSDPAPPTTGTGTESPRSTAPADAGPIAEPAPPLASAAPTPAHSSTAGTEAVPTRRGPRVRAVLAVAAFVAAIALAVAWQLVDRDGTAVATAAPSLAVLPFADLTTTDGTNGVFADGLTDELLNSLARVPGLKVIGRTSSFRFRERDADPREIGRQLGVTHVLEGSVRRTGTYFRITAQLVSTRDGFQVWSNSFDRPVTDAIPVQMQIARAVVDALAVQLSPAAAERLDRGPTAQVNAYDLYLLGRHQQLKREPAALERAIAYHRAALAADPRFALAHAGLADAYMAGYYYAGRSLEETAKLVQPEIDAALRLDPGLAEAYAAWSVLLTEQWETDEAIEKLERAIAINPNYGEAYLRLGAAYEYRAEPRKALAAYDQVASLDPLHTVLHVRRCLVLQNLGRYPEADRACERAFELQPEIPNALWARGLNAYAQGDLASAIRYHREALRRAPKRTDIRSELVLLYLDAGLPAAAVDELEQLDPAARDALAPLTRARLHLATGDRRALAQLLGGAALASAGPRERADAAFLALAADDEALALRLAADLLAPQVPPEEALVPGLYRTRWGLSERAALAQLERRRGRADAAARHEAALDAHLSLVEANGHRWHAVDYLRASLHAARGDTAAALASLQRAVERGWRRGWLIRVDPALHALRGDAQFEGLLARVEADAAEARRRLQARDSGDAD